MPTSPSPKEILAGNLRMLMRREKLTARKLAGKADIAPATMSKIMNLRSAANLDTLNSLAKALNVEPWMLILDNLSEDMVTGSGLRSMMRSYHSATPGGREMINMVAEREATYGARNDEQDEDGAFPH